MKNKYLYLILILLTLLFVTGCGKEKEDNEIEVVKKETVEKDNNDKKGIKKLSCDYDLTSSMSGGGTSSLNLSLYQNLSNNELEKGTATVIFDYSSEENITNETIQKIGDQVKASFCQTALFGEGSVKNCEIMIEEKLIEVDINIDIDNFLRSSNVSKSSLKEDFLEGAKSKYESAENSLVATCTIEEEQL